MEHSIVGLKELRGNMERYVTAVGKGKSFTIVRRSKPIFRLVPVDAWGDSGEWETVLDLTSGRKDGISANEMLARLRKINGSDK